MGYGFPGGFLFQEDDNQGSKGRGHHHHKFAIEPKVTCAIYFML